MTDDVFPVAAIVEAARILASAAEIVAGPLTRQDGRDRTLALQAILQEADDATLAAVFMGAQSARVAAENVIHARMDGAA